MRRNIVSAILLALQPPFLQNHIPSHHAGGICWERKRLIRRALCIVLAVEAFSKHQRCLNAEALGLFFRLDDSSHLTPVAIKRPRPPFSFKTSQQYLLILVGGTIFFGIKPERMVKYQRLINISKI